MAPTLTQRPPVSLRRPLAPAVGVAVLAACVLVLLVWLMQPGSRTAMTTRMITSARQDPPKRWLPLETVQTGSKVNPKPVAAAARFTEARGQFM